MYHTVLLVHQLLIRCFMVLVEFKKQNRRSKFTGFLPTTKKLSHYVTTKGFSLKHASSVLALNVLAFLEPKKST